MRLATMGRLQARAIVGRGAFVAPASSWRAGDGLVATFGMGLLYAQVRSRSPGRVWSCPDPGRGGARRSMGPPPAARGARRGRAPRYASTAFSGSQREWRVEIGCFLVRPWSGSHILVGALACQGCSGTPRRRHRVRRVRLRAARHVWRAHLGLVGRAIFRRARTATPRNAPRRTRCGGARNQGQTTLAFFQSQQILPPLGRHLWNA